MRTFSTYPDARAEAEKIVRELANGSQIAALSATQSRDALAALERLNDYHRVSGRRVSLLGAVSDYVEASTKLGGRSLTEAITGFLTTVATVKRADIAAAVEEFIKTKAIRAKAGDGQRAQVSEKYFYNLSIQLRRFANTFKNTALTDLSKEHINTFIDSLSTLSPKSRNHHRTTIRQFLQWAVRKDYLPVLHRLFESDGLGVEHGNTAPVEIYGAAEFAALLREAHDEIRPMIAIGGLAGLRTVELLRLDWADVWRTPGHIEITAGKAKTRQRRLVEMCPALAGWLKPFRTRSNGNVWAGAENTFQDRLNALCASAIYEHKGKKIAVKRKTNGLRHAFCTYHLALHSNENLTALQAGNSPSMIHGHYKGLATKTDAGKWFNVKPS